MPSALVVGLRKFKIGIIWRVLKFESLNTILMNRCANRYTECVKRQGLAK